MKKNLFVLFCLISSLIAHSQIHEVGVFLGGSNFVGDVGASNLFNYFNPNKYAVGAIYKWNKSPRHAWRASYMQTTIIGNDKRSDATGRRNRGYDFKNSLKELSMGLEFNFFDFNLHDGQRKYTPYVYSGISVIQYDELRFVNAKAITGDYQMDFAIPMTIGLKTNVLPRFILAVELSARYTFVDDLDGSRPSNKKYLSSNFGNINSNDWFMFSGFTLTYTFGKEPCYCSN